MKSGLFLHDLIMEVSLGWPEEERQQKQLIRVDLKIQFNTPPKACQSDHLDDTTCYESLVNELKHHLENKSFRLLEHLGHEIYQLCKHSLATDSRIWIQVRKNPPIPNLMGGVSFCYGDD